MVYQLLGDRIPVEDHQRGLVSFPEVEFGVAARWFAADGIPAQTTWRH